MTKPEVSPNEFVVKTHNSLREAVREALERKRRLGRYSVFWRENQVVIQGEDAQSNTS